MNEIDKMRGGQQYDYTKPEIAESLSQAKRKLKIFNAVDTDDRAAYRRALSDLIPQAAPTATVIPPLFCDHGHMIRLAQDVFINAGATILDSGGVSIGARTLIGPSCNIYTPQHPMDYIERRKPVETGLAVTIGEDCWLGGNVTVCPGVTIGDRCVIGAGSVVTHDIPDDCLAAGNPATVKRHLR